MRRLPFPTEGIGIPWHKTAYGEVAYRLENVIDIAHYAFEDASPEQLRILKETKAHLEAAYILWRSARLPWRERNRFRL